MPSSMPMKMTKVSRCERMALSPFGERLQNASSYRVRKPSCPRRGCWAPTLTSWLQPEKRSAVGLGGDDPDRHHRLRVGALNFECLDYRGQDQGGFGQRELRADAYSRTDAERQIGKAIRCRRTREKPRRVEYFRLPPQPAVPVEHPR